MGADFLLRLRMGKNKVLKKNGIPVDCIIEGKSGLSGLSQITPTFTLW